MNFPYYRTVQERATLSVLALWGHVPYQVLMFAWCLLLLVWCTVPGTIVSHTVDVVDFSDIMILDAFNDSYLANNKFRQLAPAFPGPHHRRRIYTEEKAKVVTALRQTS